MGRITDLIFGRRDATPYRMVGFPSDGGLVSSGVTATTTLGLSAVWRCLDILANGVSQLEWLERRGTLDLPLSRLATRPQAERTRREWVSLVVSTLALYDVCYLLKVGGDDSEGVPIALWPLDPGLVQPISTDYFQFLPPDEFYVGSEKVGRDRLVILHRSPQPGISDELGGVLKLARQTFASAIAAEAYASRYWQAGGSPTTYLKTDQKLPPGVAQEMADLWRDSRRLGPDNAAVLEGGLEAKPFGADPTAEAAVDARREQVADIARYFGIPSRIVNAPTGDTETYSTTESANLDLIKFTLMNYICAIQDAITDLLPGGRHIEMKLDPLTRGPYLARAQAYQLATAGKAWMTPDDVREELGLPPVENPDELNPPPPVPVVAAPGGNENAG